MLIRDGISKKNGKWHLDFPRAILNAQAVKSIVRILPLGARAKHNISCIVSDFDHLEVFGHQTPAGRYSLQTTPSNLSLTHTRLVRMSSAL